MSGPRTTDGRRLHCVAAETWAVGVDASDREVTERIPGRIWLAFSRLGRIDFFFDPDEADKSLKVKAGGLRAIVVFIDGDEVQRFPCTGWKGQDLAVNWAPALDLMA